MFNLDFLNPGLFPNFDLLTVGITIAAIGILGFVVYTSNRKSITNQSFLIFAILTILYGIFNYLNYKVVTPALVLWLLRFTLFVSVWHAFYLYQLFLVFPKPYVAFNRFHRYFLLPWVGLVSFITLTPLVFSSITAVAAGQVTNPNRGPGIALFGMTAFGLVAAAIIILLKKTVKAEGEEKKQFKLVLSGTIIAFSLILLCNLLLPLVFNYVRLVPFAPLFILPFIIFTAYSIVKHHLLRVKVLAADILVFALAIAILFEVVTSEQSQVLIFRFSIFLLVLGVGILLIRSVNKEVEQRERLEALTKQLEEANEKLKQLDQARADFITIASHQLRTPPATIKWYLSALLSGDYGEIPAEVKTQIEKTQLTNNGLIALIDDMLNASRIERGKMEFMFESSNLEPITQFTVDQLIPQASMKQLKLVYNKPSQPLPDIMIDKEKIRQVINNLIDNAIKYTQAGTITVNLEQRANDLVVSVTDTGKGVAKNEAATLFEKYNRGKTSATHASGLGLGLYVAKIIIEQHKGKIWAESPGEGLGSTFAFSLPIHSDLKETTLLDLSQAKV